MTCSSLKPTRCRHGSARERGVDLEGWVFCRGTDQADRPTLDVGKKGVLLRLVEAVDLVDEEDSARAVACCLLSLDHHLLDSLDSAQDGGELDEGRLGALRDDLPRVVLPVRAPRNHGGRVVILDCQTQRLACPSR